MGGREAGILLPPVTSNSYATGCKNMLYNYTLFASFTDACMVWHLPIFRTTSIASLTSTATISGHHHPRGWLSDEHSYPLSAIVRFRSPVATSGRAYHLTSLISSNAHCIFGIASKLSFCQIISFLTFCDF